jgi:phenylpropionate dioxygenase-like ring-hydroxylating dioxygenase large terminal subunit
VVFRDFRGAVGLLELHCPHRGTSLEFGLISERGIRCCYHGWLFDVDGAILETPGTTPAWWADRDVMLPGQLAADSYEAGQRQPGDYEA